MHVETMQYCSQYYWASRDISCDVPNWLINKDELANLLKWEFVRNPSTQKL